MRVREAVARPNIDPSSAETVSSLANNRAKACSEPARGGRSLQMAELGSPLLGGAELLHPLRLQAFRARALHET